MKRTALRLEKSQDPIPDPHRKSWDQVTNFTTSNDLKAGESEFFFPVFGRTNTVSRQTNFDYVACF